MKIKPCISGTILILLAAPLFVAAQTVNDREPVFVHAKCDGKSSAAVLEVLKEQVAASRKYVVIPRLDATGKSDEVFEIYMHCTQGHDMVAIATSYGKGKCFGPNKCASMIDGGSIESTLCDNRTTDRCGRDLFASFDEYVSQQKASSR